MTEIVEYIHLNSVDKLPQQSKWNSLWNSLSESWQKISTKHMACPTYSCLLTLNPQIKNRYVSIAIQKRYLELWCGWYVLSHIFIWHSYLDICSCHTVFQQLSFHCWVVFHDIDVPQFSIPCHLLILTDVWSVLGFHKSHYYSLG